MVFTNVRFHSLHSLDTKQMWLPIPNYGHSVCKEYPCVAREWATISQSNYKFHINLQILSDDDTICESISRTVCGVVFEALNSFPFRKLKLIYKHSQNVTNVELESSSVAITSSLYVWLPWWGFNFADSALLPVDLSCLDVRFSKKSVILSSNH